VLSFFAAIAYFGTCHFGNKHFGTVISSQELFSNISAQAHFGIGIFGTM
jgi:hypothetical protein